MSWEAVAWANRQKLRLPQEQLVLLVLANAADPDGCAFARWTGKEHWWKYLMQRTRLSRASVFRHLNTIEELGLGARVQMILADGTKRPLMQLDLTKLVDMKAIEAEEESAAESHGETEEADAESHGETEEADAESHSETGASLTVRPDESHGETDSNIDSKRDSIPPNPPKGGVRDVFDPDLERDLAEAQRVYPGPITNLPRLRSVMDAMAPTERQRVLTAMRGYASFIADCERKNKPRAVKDADRWVAGGMWTGYEYGGEKAEAAALVQHVAVDSPEGRALAVLHKIAGLSPPMVISGTYRLKKPIEPQVLHILDAPEESAWAFVPETAANQVGAWREFLKKALDKPLGLLIRDRVWRGREKISQRGFIAPWPWPPSIDGKVYASTGPPSSPTMTTEDEKFLAQGGLK